MSEVTARITARGLHKGKPVVIECIEYDGNDEDKRHVTILKNGEEDLLTEISLKQRIMKNRIASVGHPQSYNPPFNSAAAYWLALEDYFDAPPEILIEGEVGTFGSSYSDEDTSNVRF